MLVRLHPLVYATTGLFCLSVLAVAAPVWLGWTESSMPWDPWFTSYSKSFFSDAGRGIVALFGISAAFANLLRREGEEYLWAVWGWGAIAAVVLLALIMHSISHTLATLFGF